MKKQLLGVEIDYVSIDQSIEIVNNWLKSRGKHYIVTPNPEMIVDAGSDTTFKKALNEADLAIPDSPRLSWGSIFQDSTNPFFRLIYWPFFLLPSFLSGNHYPTTAGTDLVERLIEVSQEKGYTTAYLGGNQQVAIKLLKCLRQKYPKLKISFCSGDIAVDRDGKSQFDINKDNLTMSKNIKPNLSGMQELNPHILTEKVDILFVAFGHIKQEKWMNRNLSKLNARVMIGVGGAFDYLSGSVPRAPKILRSIGMEWIFRFIIQPWRIKRFWKLPYFVYKVMTAN